MDGESALTDQELLDFYYIHGTPPQQEKNEPDDLPLLTPGETVVVVLLGVVIACIATPSILALLRIAS